MEHPEAFADIWTEDGKCKGKYYYSDSDGYATWDYKCNYNGVTKSYQYKAKKTPLARVKSANSYIDQTRRQVIRDTTGKHAIWTVRTNTKSTLNKPSKCYGDTDLKVPFTLDFYFYKCS
jgi:hypothetical protein